MIAHDAGTRDKAELRAGLRQKAEDLCDHCLETAFLMATVADDSWPILRDESANRRQAGA